MRDFFRRIRNIIVNIFQLGTKKATGIILYLLSFPLRYGVWFFAYYFIFVYDKNDVNATVNGTIILGVVFSISAVIMDWLKHKVKKTTTKPLLGVIPRIFYRLKYIFVLSAGFVFVTITISYTKIYWYLGVCLVSSMLGILFEGIKLKIFEEEWID